MTVKEFIDLLKTCNPDYEVVIEGDASIGEVVEHRGLRYPEHSVVQIWYA